MQPVQAYEPLPSQSFSSRPLQAIHPLLDNPYDGKRPYAILLLLPFKFCKMQSSEQGRPLDAKMCGSITSPSKCHSVRQAWEVDRLEVEFNHKLTFSKPVRGGDTFSYF